MSGQTPSWLSEFLPETPTRPRIIEQLARPMTAIDRLRNGGQIDLADQVDKEIREAYAAGRQAERENLERIGAVADCGSCGGRGERMVAAGYGPDVYQELIDCPDCHGTGYACVSRLQEALAKVEAGMTRVDEDAP